MIHSELVSQNTNDKKEVDWHKKLRVCCPKEFWKSVNVRYYCKVFNIPLFDNLETLLQHEIR